MHQSMELLPPSPPLLPVLDTIAPLLSPVPAPQPWPSSSPVTAGPLPSLLAMAPAVSNHTVVGLHFLHRMEETIPLVHHQSVNDSRQRCASASHARHPKARTTIQTYRRWHCSSSQAGWLTACRRKAPSPSGEALPPRHPEKRTNKRVWTNECEAEIGQEDRAADVCGLQSN